MDGIDCSFSGFGGGGEYDDMDLETYDEFDIEAAPKEEVKAEVKKKEPKKKKSKEKKVKEVEVKELVRPYQVAQAESSAEKKIKLPVPEEIKPDYVKEEFLSKLTNEELEQVKAILETQVKLSDGSNAYVFSKTNPLSPSMSPYHCHVCDQEVAGKQRGLLIHAGGRKHLRLMGLPSHPAKNFRDSLKKVAAQNGATGIIPINISKQPKQIKKSQFGKNRNLMVKEQSPVPEVTEVEADIEEQPQMISKPPETQVFCMEIEKAFHTKTKLQASLDSYTEAPLIGLEYICEVRPNDPNKAIYDYHCLMCSAVLATHKIVFTHIVSYQHRINYLQKYFPGIHARIQSIPMTKEYRVPLGTFVQDVIRRIEQRYGRLSPLSIVKKIFETKRSELRKKLEDSIHFRENETFNFDTLPLPTPQVEPEPIIDAKETSRRSEASKLGKTDLIDISDGESESDFASKSGLKRGSKKDLSPESEKRARLNRLLRSPPRRGARSRSTSRERLRRYRRRSHSRSPHSSRRRSQSPSAKRPYRNKSPSPSKQSHNDKRRVAYDERGYQRDLKALETEMDRIRHYYEKYPEKHPRYAEEWKSFWNKRYVELKSQGKDPKTFNFKPEWITVWDSKWHNMHGKEVAKKRFDLKVKYGLEQPDTKEEESVSHAKPKLSSKEEREVKSAEFRSKEKKTEREADVKEVTVTDIKNTWKALTGGDIRDTSQEPSKPMTVVAALRLMTALEDMLGSLGPRVNALLSQALSMEKIGAGVSESLLAVSEHLVLIETSVEKLRGQIAAGLVEGKKKRAVEKVIADVSRLLQNAPQSTPPPSLGLASLLPATSGTPPVHNLPSESNVPLTRMAVASQVSASLSVRDVVDKVGIAEKIAKILIENGRTDITEAELNELVNDVVVTGALSSVTGAPQPTPNLAQPTPNLSQPTPNLSWKDEHVAVHTPPISTTNVDSNRMSVQAPVHEEKDMELSQSPDHLEELSMVDLQNLLQNFQTLSPYEQNILINYVKKLEKTNPEKVKIASNFFTPKVPNSTAASNKVSTTLQTESGDDRPHVTSSTASKSAEEIVQTRERSELAQMSERLQMSNAALNLESRPSDGNKVGQRPFSDTQTSMASNKSVSENVQMTSREAPQMPPKPTLVQKEGTPATRNITPPRDFRNGSPPAEFRNTTQPAQPRQSTLPAELQKSTQPSELRNSTPPAEYRNKTPPTDYRNLKTENKNVYESILENARRQFNATSSRIPVSHDKPNLPSFLGNPARNTNIMRDGTDVEDVPHSPDMMEIEQKSPSPSKPLNSQKSAITLNLKTPLGSLKKTDPETLPSIPGLGSQFESPMSQFPWTNSKIPEDRRRTPSGPLTNPLQIRNSKTMASPDKIPEGSSISTLGQHQLPPSYPPQQQQYRYPTMNPAASYTPLGPAPYYPQGGSNYPGDYRPYYGNR